MALFIIGIGLNDEKDITLRGLELVKQADKVYLETYTSIMQVSIDRLSEFYGKKVIPADRNLVENEAEKLITPAVAGNVALLIPGDPLGATTHRDIISRAQQAGVQVFTVHNASIITAVAETGLFLYKFGKTASIPFSQPGFSPESFFDVYLDNKNINAHTLMLLDLKPPKYMTANEALVRLVGIATKRGIARFEETKAVVCCRLGTPGAAVFYGAISSLFQKNFGTGPHCVILPGPLHFVEEDALKSFQ